MPTTGAARGRVERYETTQEIKNSRSARRGARNSSVRRIRMRIAFDPPNRRLQKASGFSM